MALPWLDRTDAEHHEDRVLPCSSVYLSVMTEKNIGMINWFSVCNVSTRPSVRDTDGRSCKVEKKDWLKMPAYAGYGGGLA